jgi:hypothetical protein
MMFYIMLRFLTITLGLNMQPFSCMDVSICNIRGAQSHVLQVGFLKLIGF